MLFSVPDRVRDVRDAVHTFMTEPDIAGSDPTHLRTKAVLE